MAEINPFWRYSLRLYAQPGIADLCLELQDRVGVDVNMLLFCYWLDVQQTPLDQAFLENAQYSVESWQNNVVKPLRGVRKHIGRVEEDFYRQLCDVELEAERAEQNMLFDCYRRASLNGTVGADGYLHAYLTQFDEITPATYRSVLSQFSNVFPENTG